MTYKFYLCKTVIKRYDNSNVAFGLGKDYLKRSKVLVWM